MDPTVPMHLLALSALTDCPDEPTSAVQYAVVNAEGTDRYVYGDQSWVAYGAALSATWWYEEDGHRRGDLIHPGGKIQRRTITITYGDWEDAPERRTDEGGAS